MNQNDIIIIGAGAAGLTAAIYVQRAGKHAILIEKEAPGGQIITANEIENYPGFESVNGADFSFKLYNQALSLGATYVASTVTNIKADEHGVVVETTKETYEGIALIYAAGAAHRHIGLDNENKLIGKGVSFCANCDGAFFKGKTVAVFGGGNTALDDAAYLSNLASKVYLVHRRQEYRAEMVLQEKVKGINNIEPVLDSIIVGLKEKEGTLSGIVVRNVKTSEETVLDVDGLFVAIGMIPQTDLIKDLVKLDEAGYIEADESTETNIPTIFAAGDVRKKQVRQLTTATADGTTAAVKASAL